MRIAARSSIIAIETNVNLSDSGTLLPKRVNTPRANAMSVAAGIAQPCKAVEFPQLSDM